MVAQPTPLNKKIHWEEWNPKAYLETYFSKIEEDEEATLRFLIDAFKSLPKRDNVKILDFGAGPIPIHAMVVAPYVDEIHIADYLAGNLHEIQQWLFRAQHAFNWDFFVKRILALEGKPVTAAAIENRIEETTRKVKRLLLCDAADPDPLLDAQDDDYSIVMSIFCADSATDSKEKWLEYMSNITSLVAPGGQLLLAALHECVSYKVGDKVFPSANLTVEDMKNMLIQYGFSRDLRVDVVSVPGSVGHGFSSLLFACAQKSDIMQ